MKAKVLKIRVGNAAKKVRMKTKPAALSPYTSDSCKSGGFTNELYFLLNKMLLNFKDHLFLAY